MATNTAAAAAMLGWLAVEKMKSGHATTLGGASGAVAGLVAITPCAGFVNPMAAVAIGLIAGVVCFLACQLKFKFGFDDSLDVIAVHLVGGITGSLLLGVFANEAFGGLLGGRRLLAAGQAVRGGGGDARLLGRRVVHPGQDHRQDDRPAGLGGRRGHGPRSQPARRVRLRCR